VYNARRYNVNMEQFPTINRVVANVEAHEFARLSHPDAQPDAVKDAPK
jgi:hypothetical protein